MALDALVINLTRLGDLLQTAPAIADMRDAGWKVGLICQENFAGALGLLGPLDGAWQLPGARLLRELDRDWPAAVSLLDEFSRQVRSAGAPRRIINLTPSTPARLLAAMLTPEPGGAWGFGLDAMGFGVNRGSWASYLSAAAAARVHSPFNLVDIMRRVCQPLLGPAISQRPGRFSLAHPGRLAVEAARVLLAEQPGPGAAPAAYVAFQLGASEARRQWPAGHFAALGDMLWREGRYCPVLLGSPAEAELAQAYAAASASPFVNAVGRTGIPELAALLLQCRLLVSNDTGTLHLAAGLGVHSLSFFLATAQATDTGPYLADCCCLEPALACQPCGFDTICQSGESCRTELSPRLAADLALGWLGGRGWVASPESSSAARIWISGRDEYGLAAMRCLSAPDCGERNFSLARQREFWRRFLDDLDGCPDSRPLPRPEGAKPGTQLLSALEQAQGLLDLLLQQAAMLGRLPRAGRLFLINCERLQALLDDEPELHALGQFWRELRQARGDRMEELVSLMGALKRHLGEWTASLE